MLLFFKNVRLRNLLMKQRQTHAVCARARHKIARARTTLKHQPY